MSPRPAIFLLSALLLLTGCSAPGGALSPSSAPSVSVAPTPTSTPAPTPTPDPAEVLLSSLTAEEKVGQLLLAGFSGTEPGEAVRKLIQTDHVGGLILYGYNVESAEQLCALTNGLKALNGNQPPLFLSVDQEGGTVDRMPPELHRLPSAYAVGNQAGADGAGTLGNALGAECAAFGLNLDFAPVADIWSNPENTVIGKRAFGSDASAVSACVPAAVTAIQSHGVLSVMKHFPGHGDTAVDSHVGLPVVNFSLEALRERELLPFEAAPDASGIMVAHIVFTALGEKPATLNPKVVTGLLREELGYQGLIFTDDLTMGAITQNYDLGDAAVEAFEAGCDVLLVCHGTDTVTAARQAILDAVASGRISEARLDESVLRILRAKLSYGLNGDPVSLPDLDALNALVDQVPG